MACTTKVAALSMGALRIIALFIIMLSLKVTNRCGATTAPTSGMNTEEGEFDDNSPIDQLLILQESIMESGEITSNGSRRMMHSEDGTVRVELDMLLTDEQWMTRQKRINGSRHRRKVVTESQRLWPNAVVPYVLASSFNQKEAETLHRAMQQFQAFSCVRFRNRNSKDEHYIEFSLAGVSESFVGRQESPQALRLSHTGAKRVKIVVHELGHALGFEHEHNRPDRDDFILINECNVEPDMQYNFHKASTDELETFDVPYDYLSIMHYGEKAFAKNGLTTIHAKNSSYQHEMGKSSGLTFNDVKHLNKMYRCADQSRCARRMKCPGDGFVGQDCKCYCPPPRSLWKTQPAVMCSECVDYDELCPLFRQRGFCTHRLFSDHMTYRCPQSCNRCIVNVRASSSTSPGPV